MRNNRSCYFNSDWLCCLIYCCHTGEPAIAFLSNTSAPDTEYVGHSAESQLILAEGTPPHQWPAESELLERYDFVEDAGSWYYVLYDQKDFARIENFVAQSLAKELTDEIASAYLGRLYTALSDLSTSRDNIYAADDDEKLEQNLTILDEWIARFPNSHVPYLLKGKLLRNYGWEIRGNRYASRVQPDAWPKFYQALAAARVELERAASLTPKDPNIWAALMDIAREQPGANDDLAAAYFEKGLAANPYHGELWLTKGWWLDPRWGGNYGQLIEFAQDIEKLAIENDKPILGAVSLAAYRKIFTRQEAEHLESEIIWDSIQGLYGRIFAAHPDNLRMRFYYAHDAYYANKPQIAAAQFDILGSQWAPETAWDDIEELHNARAFTYYEVAYAAFSEGRYNDAKALALHSIDISPSAYTYLLLASMEGNIYHDMETTIHYARQALLSSPTEEERAQAEETIELAEAYINEPQWSH